MAQPHSLRRSRVEQFDAVTTTHSTSLPEHGEVATATLHAAAAAQRRPSRRPEILALQLQRELQRLEGSASDSAEREDAYHLVRAYLLQAHTLAWRGVHHGDLMAPRTIVQALFEVRPFVDRFLPDLDDAQQLAAEIDGTFGAFLAADRVLERLRTEARLADPKVSKSERAVLEVLTKVEDDLLLRRNQIYQRLPDPKPTLPRVGQILADLYRDGYLTRQFASARGNALTAHYGLSALGRGLCDALGMKSQATRSSADDENSAVAILLEAFLSGTSEHLPEATRRVAQGVIESALLRWETASLVRKAETQYKVKAQSTGHKNAPISRKSKRQAQHAMQVLHQQAPGTFRLGPSTRWELAGALLGELEQYVSSWRSANLEPFSERATSTGESSASSS